MVRPGPAIEAWDGPLARAVAGSARTTITIKASLFTAYASTPETRLEFRLRSTADSRFRQPWYEPGQLPHVRADGARDGRGGDVAALAATPLELFGLRDAVEERAALAGDGEDDAEEVLDRTCVLESACGDGLEARVADQQPRSRRSLRRRRRRPCSVVLSPLRSGRRASAKLALNAFATGPPVSDFTYSASDSKPSGLAPRTTLIASMTGTPLEPTHGTDRVGDRRAAARRAEPRPNPMRRRLLGPSRRPHGRPVARALRALRRRCLGRSS